MTAILQQTEGTVDGYDAPEGLSTEALPFVDSAWQRIESFIAWRWPVRPIEWVAEGPGDWQPPLKPAEIATTKTWNGTAWETVELQASPLGGYQLPGCGPYQFVGTVGDDSDPPAIVLEAARRLCEYMGAKVGKPGVRSESVTAGTVSLSTTRSPTATAEALQNSGAADLLRTFRRA